MSECTRARDLTHAQFAIPRLLNILRCKNISESMISCALTYASTKNASRVSLKSVIWSDMNAFILVKNHTIANYVINSLHLAQILSSTCRCIAVSFKESSSNVLWQTAKSPTCTWVHWRSTWLFLIQQNTSARLNLKRFIWLIAKYSSRFFLEALFQKKLKNMEKIEQVSCLSLIRKSPHTLKEIRNTMIGYLIIMDFK